MLNKWVIILLVLIGVSLRLIALDRIPVHLSNDEISIAYDAYSLARTGRDEHNIAWPISFQSHGTYKAPLYGYLLAPLTLILPNTAATARLPSAVSGILTILVVGAIAWTLTKNKTIAGISMVILSLTPWHIYASRMALEANVALLFLSLSVWGWLKSTENGGWKWGLLGGIFGVVSMYGYHTEWLLFPLLMMGVMIWLWPKKKWLSLMPIMVMILVLMSPIIFDFISRLGTNARANTEMMWKQPGVEAVLKDPKSSMVKKVDVLGGALIYSYFDYLSPGYLFFYGQALFTGLNVFNPGLFLAPLLPMLIIGFFGLSKTIDKKYIKFFWYWFLVSPLIPGMTHGGNNLVRNLVSVIPLTLVMAVGVFYFWQRIKLSKLIRGGWVVLSFLYFMLFATSYFYHFPIHSGIGYQYGYRQIADWINGYYSRYDRIIVELRFGDSNRFIGVPHLYLAYFTNLDPIKMLKRRESHEGLFFDKYNIKQVDWPRQEIRKNDLFAVPVSNLPPETLDSLKEVKTIYLPDKKEAFKLYEVVK